MQRAVNSLLDTDLYILTQSQFAFDQARESRAKYRFACRNAEAAAHLAEKVTDARLACLALTDLRLTPEEEDYLRGLGYFSEAYLAHLREYRFNSRQLTIERKQGEFALEVEGPWVDAIMWEVPLLATLSETLFRGKSTLEGERRLVHKVARLKQLEGAGREGLEIVEFGTRRRRAAFWQYHVLRTLLAQVPWAVSGTSNVSLAKTFGIRCVGTMAHQYFQAWQVLAPHLRNHQQAALGAWQKQFAGKLGIALTDCVTTEAFLGEFTRPLAEGYDGVRHDSGDPFAWGCTVADHYTACGIDPQGKTAVWSDGLDIETAIRLRSDFRDTFRRTVFGIGTHLTNDCGHPAMDGVIKLVAFDGKPVAKISDAPGKAVCDDPAYLARLKAIYGIGG